MEEKRGKGKFMEKTYQLDLAGKPLIIETGKLALGANGAVTVRYGGTVVLATAVMAEKANEESDYFPLLVDYEEKLYAAGKIKGSRFVKREGKPSDEAITTSRLIDRSIRPLFSDKMRHEVQVIATVLSFDDENDADIIALIGAASALHISDIPFSGPLGGVRIGRINGKFIINPTFSERLVSDLDLIVAANKKDVIMLEGEGKEIKEKDFLSAIKMGKGEIVKILDLQEKMQKEVGKKKAKVYLQEENEELAKKVTEKYERKMKEILETKSAKKEINLSIKDLSAAATEEFSSQYSKEDIEHQLNVLHEKIVRQNILEKEFRVGGRKLDELRPINCRVGILPRTHGSGFFQRGETQILTIATLGGPGSELILDGMEKELKKRYIHYYNFPPFSVGEIAPLRGPGRREVGHGALAEKALVPVLPDIADFPYTILLVSEVLSCNGSSSMGSVCGSSLALMDGGVPIKKHVAGVAMGLVSDGKGKYKILTDIAGMEDQGGDMDFKIAGTEEGITAVQLDIKISALPMDVIEKTLLQAKKAREEILQKMQSAIKRPRRELSPYAPRLEIIQIDPKKIGDVIGPGGKTINAIIEATNVEIDIEDDGKVIITAQDEKAIKKAVEWVKNLTREVKTGEKFMGRVTRITNFGAFVEILPGQEGLVHISQFADHRIRKVEDFVKVGDIIPVMVVDVGEDGKISLSYKAARKPRPSWR